MTDVLATFDILVILDVLFIFAYYVIEDENVWNWPLSGQLNPNYHCLGYEIG